MPTHLDPLSAAFGSAVRERRLAAALSQEALAELTQVQRTYVVDLEGGRRNPTLRTIARFADALGVTLGDLLADVDHRLR